MGLIGKAKEVLHKATGPDQPVAPPPTVDLEKQQREQFAVKAHKRVVEANAARDNLETAKVTLEQAKTREEIEKAKQNVEIAHKEARKALERLEGIIKFADDTFHEKLDEIVKARLPKTATLSEIQLAAQLDVLAEQATKLAKQKLEAITKDPNAEALAVANKFVSEYDPASQTWELIGRGKKKIELTPATEHIAKTEFSPREEAADKVTYHLEQTFDKAAQKYAKDAYFEAVINVDGTVKVTYDVTPPAGVAGAFAKFEGTGNSAKFIEDAFNNYNVNVQQFVETKSEDERKADARYAILEGEKKFITAFDVAQGRWEMGGEAIVPIDSDALEHATYDKDDSDKNFTKYFLRQEYSKDAAGNTLSVRPAEFVLKVTKTGVEIRSQLNDTVTVGPITVTNPPAAAREYKKFKAGVENFITTEVEKKSKQEQAEAALKAEVEKYVSNNPVADKKFETQNGEELELAFDDSDAFLEAPKAKVDTVSGVRTFELTREYKDTAKYGAHPAKFALKIKAGEPAKFEYVTATGEKPKKGNVKPENFKATFDLFVEATKTYCTNKKLELEKQQAKADLLGKRNDLIEAGPIAANEVELKGGVKIGAEANAYLEAGTAKEKVEDTFHEIVITRKYTKDPDGKVYSDQPAVFKIHVEKDKSVASYQLAEGGAESAAVEVKNPADVKNIYDELIKKVTTAGETQKFANKLDTKELLNTARIREADRKTTDKFAVLKNLDGEFTRNPELKKHIEALIKALAHGQGSEQVEGNLQALGTLLGLEVGALADIFEAQTAQIDELAHHEFQHAQDHAAEAHATPAAAGHATGQGAAHGHAAAHGAGHAPAPVAPAAPQIAQPESASKKGWKKTAWNVATVGGAGLAVGWATGLAPAGIAASWAVRVYGAAREHFATKSGLAKAEKKVRDSLQDSASAEHKKFVDDMLIRLSTAIEQNIKSRTENTNHERALTAAKAEYSHASREEKIGKKGALALALENRAQEIHEGSLIQLAKRYGMEQQFNDAKQKITDAENDLASHHRLGGGNLQQLEADLAKANQDYQDVIKPIEGMADSVRRLYIVEENNQIFADEVHHNSSKRAVFEGLLKKIDDYTLGASQGRTRDKMRQATGWALLGIAISEAPGLRLLTTGLAGMRLGVAGGKWIGERQAPKVEAVTIEQLQAITDISDSARVSEIVNRARFQLATAEHKGHGHGTGRETIRLQQEIQRLETLLANDARLRMNGVLERNNHLQAQHEQKLKAENVKFRWKVIGGALGAAAGAAAGHYIGNYFEHRKLEGEQAARAEQMQKDEQAFQEQWARDRADIINRPLTQEQIARAFKETHEEMTVAEEAAPATPSTSPAEPAVRYDGTIHSKGHEGFSHPLKRWLEAKSNHSVVGQELRDKVDKTYIKIGGKDVYIRDIGNNKQLWAMQGDATEARFTEQADGRIEMKLYSTTGDRHALSEEELRSGVLKEHTIVSPRQTTSRLDIKGPAVDVQTHQPGSGKNWLNSSELHHLSPQDQWAQMQETMARYPEQFKVTEYTPANGLTTEMYAPNGELIHAFHNPLDADSGDYDYYYIENGKPHIIDNETSAGKDEFAAIQKPYVEGTKFENVDLTSYTAVQREIITRELFAHRTQVNALENVLNKDGSTMTAEVRYHLNEALQDMKADYNATAADYTGHHPYYASDATLDGLKTTGLKLNTHVDGVGEFKIGTNATAHNVEQTIKDQTAKTVEAAQKHDWLHDSDRHFDIAKVDALGKPAREFSLGFEKNSGLYHQAKQWVKLSDRLYEKFPLDHAGARNALDNIQSALERGQLPDDVQIDGVHVSNAELQAGDESIHKLVNKLAA